jgi:hypothetical protein
VVKDGDITISDAAAGKIGSPHSQPIQSSTQNNCNRIMTKRTQKQKSWPETKTRIVIGMIDDSITWPCASIWNKVKSVA